MFKTKKNGPIHWSGQKKVGGNAGMTDIKVVVMSFVHILSMSFSILLKQLF